MQRQLPFSLWGSVNVIFNSTTCVCASVCQQVSEPFVLVAWQQSERVSVRLAARETVPEPQQPTSHDARYAVSSYHTQPNVYSFQQLPSLPQQLLVPETTQTHLESASGLSTASTTSSSSKRLLQEEESTPAPKPKRAKAKSKSGTPGSTSAPGALSGFF
jgi:lysine-specific demethylase 3